MATREIELLAPARDLPTGREAILHGADAVYIGGPRFGARAAAGNSVEDIAELVRFARPYGVKVYVTLNTILYDDELEGARRLAHRLAEVGVDALIVQDVGLVYPQFTIHNSQLPLHASTQMDNRTAEKVAWLAGLGFRQVVLARELTLREIGEIHRRVPGVRLEVFVHGAICVSYNGQCYASQHCFGRSANRGECAQFCRMPFDLIEVRSEKGEVRSETVGAAPRVCPETGGERVLQRQRHLLSLRDMNRSADLEALLDAGVSSLKIEGRLKDVGYVKNVVAYYRQRLDEIFRRRPNEYRRSSLGHETVTFRPDPKKSFNRLFTDYFLHGRTRDMANIHTPKSMGEPIAPLPAPPVGGRAFFPLEGVLHNGDGLCYINGEGRLEGFRVNRVEGRRVYLSGQARGAAPTRVALYRNHDQEFEQRLSKPTATRKVGVRWLLRDVPEGFLLRLTREDGESWERVFGRPHELARTPQRESVVRQLSRLGDTPYEATGVEVEMSENWFIPASVLAEWRRETLPNPPLKGGNIPRPLEDSRERQGTRLSPLPAREGRGGSLSYRANVANHAARRFYLDHGAERVDWAMEVCPPQRRPGEGLLLMTCRYCIRHELGMCLKVRSEKGEVRSERVGADPRVCPTTALYLRLADGRRFRLRFDCKQCQMEVYAE